MEKSSCINDLPVKIFENDILHNNIYVDGLADFIVSSTPPITIGVQGGWGSGKTSLISLLKLRLNDVKDNKSLPIFVNAWEYSLFQAKNSKAEVALSLLQGIIENINKEIENTNLIPEAVKNEILNKDGVIDKAKKITACIGKFALRATTSYLTGSDIDITGQSKNDDQNSLGQNIRNLKNTLMDIVTKITQYPNCPQRIVVFVDDLDRVQPEIAIEILDVIKNIFEIHHCVFVLAIDFEVVVKGLEAKYGKKTIKNEREYRQYFDKIIQIPFSMPVNSYESQMDAMIMSSLETIGIDFADQTEDNVLISNMSNAIFVATGGNPRSIKRIINTLSLITRFKNNIFIKSDTSFSNEDIELLVILVSLQITFPDFYNALAQNPNFLSWDKNALINDTNPSNILSSETNLNFNYPWVEAIYLRCQEDEFLKNSFSNIVTIFESIKESLNRIDDSTDNSLSEVSLQKLEEILLNTNITSVTTKTIQQKTKLPELYSTFFIEIYNRLLQVKKYDFSINKKPFDEDHHDYHRFFVAEYKYISFWVQARRKENITKLCLDFVRRGKGIFEANFKKIAKHFNDIPGLIYTRKIDIKSPSIATHFDVDVQSEDFIKNTPDFVVEKMVEMLDILKELNLE